MAETPALALDTGDGFQNPAALRLSGGTRIRGTAAALNTGTDRGISAQLASVAVALPQQITVGLSAARASINGIGRTIDDPEPIGRDIPYSTFVASLTGARRAGDRVTSGVAVRYRSGELDGIRRSTFGLDGGVVIERVFGYDARVGLASYLWGPGSGGTDEASFSGAFDARVLGADSLQQARAGYAYTAGEGSLPAHYVFVSGRYSRWLGRAGIAHTSAYGNGETTLRLGIGVRYARYFVALSREEGAGDFAPTYQIVLSGSFH